MPSARSIEARTLCRVLVESIANCIDAVLSGAHVDESTQGAAGGRSGSSEINYINRNVQACID